MITTKLISELNTKMAMTIVTPIGTYYLQPATCQLLTDSSLVFFDSLRKESVRIKKDIDLDQVNTFGHLLWPTAADQADLEKWFEARKEDIETNNKLIQENVESRVLAAGEYINDRLMFDRIQDWDCNLNTLQVYIDLSRALKLSNPVFSEQQLVAEVPVEKARECWIEVIKQHHAKAIVVLDKELEIATNDDDQEAIQEIVLVKEMLQESVDAVDLSTIETTKEVILYWPPLLLPAPEFTSFFRL